LNLVGSPTNSGDDTEVTMVKKSPAVKNIGAMIAISLLTDRRLCQSLLHAAGSRKLLTVNLATAALLFRSSLGRVI
jgi:hypothetical protein